MTRAALIAALCTLLLLGGGIKAAGATAADQQAQLKTLRARIAKVQANLDRDIQTRGKVQQQLRGSEQQIAQLSADLRGLNRSVADAQSRLKTLQHQQAQKQAALDAQKDALAKQIRAAYMEGRDSQLQLLLNAQDPATIGRLLAYYDYFNKARATRIQAVRSELDALATINAQVQQQLTALSRLRDQRSRALAKLEQSRATRKRVLAQLNTSIQTRGAQLARMKQDERSIEDLLANLQQTLSDIPADLEGHHRFASLRGRLPWPVAGRIIQSFGAPLAGGRLRAHGDLIAAPLGTPVRAVSYGRVVFADWLPHFGLLVIVDHGDNYMSIYAHNQSVYVHVGDWVQMGETIATLGDSGGQNEASLYFEIRHRGTALSPRDWCRGRLPGG
ncbi:MAG: peptidoglycan DD-metalloendopeptidase family protein [Gammaproteobacteria bacterium]